MTKQRSSMKVLAAHLTLLNCIREDTRRGLVSMVWSFLLARGHLCKNDWLRDRVIGQVP